MLSGDIQNVAASAGRALLFEAQDAIGAASLEVKGSSMACLRVMARPGSAVVDAASSGDCHLMEIPG